MPDRDGTVCIFSSRRAIDDPDGEAREDKARGAGRGRAHDNIDLSSALHSHPSRTPRAQCTVHCARDPGGRHAEGPKSAAWATMMCPIYAKE